MSSALLSNSERIFLAFIPKVTGLLSLLGSSIIVYAVLRCPRKRTKIYHRLITGVSLFDINNSLFFGLATWPIPSSSNFKWAIGNHYTCMIQGFFIQVGIAASLFNGALAMYYYLTLRHNWKERDFQRHEKLLYGIPIIWSFSTAIISIPLKLYNNATLWCWIAPYPAGCTGEVCIRGMNASTYRWLFYYGPLWTMIVIVTICHISLYYHIKSVVSIASDAEAKAAEQQQQQQQQNTNNNEGNHGKRSLLLDNRKSIDEQQQQLDIIHEHEIEIIDESFSSMIGIDPMIVVPNHNNNENSVQLLLMDPKMEERKKQIMEAKRRHIQEIQTQCFLYAGSFYLNWFALTTVRIMQAVGIQVGFSVLAIAATVTPFQGLPNLIVYIYPSFLSERRNHPEQSFLQCVRLAILK